MSIRTIGPAAIPNLGLGTFKLDDATAREVVAAALAEGYRHVDTAQAYGNEKGVGQAIRDASVPRSEIFLTTKILPEKHGADDFRRAAEESLERLGTDYVDLLLLHWPSRSVPLAETLPVLDALIEEGKVRHGGVSNFTIALVEEARATMSAPIAANQVEMHPFIDQTRLLQHLSDNDIPFEAYSPLAQGKVVEDPVLGEIADGHGVSPAEVSLAWILSKPGGIAIPKTANADRLPSNLHAAELSLSEEELARIDTLARPDGRLISPEGMAPDWD